MLRLKYVVFLGEPFWNLAWPVVRHLSCKKDNCPFPLGGALVLTARLIKEDEVSEEVCIKASISALMQPVWAQQAIFSLSCQPLCVHAFPFNPYDDMLNVLAQFKNSFCVAGLVLTLVVCAVFIKREVMVYPGTGTGSSRRKQMDVCIKCNVEALFKKE